MIQCFWYTLEHVYNVNRDSDDVDKQDVVSIKMMPTAKVTGGGDGKLEAY